MSGTIIKVTITALYVQTSAAYQPRPEFLVTVLNRAECYYGRISGLILAEMSIRFRRFGCPHMRIRRSLPIVLTVLAVAAAVALLVVLRKHAPPEPARLLPGADGFVYVNLQWMRRANIIGELPPVPHDPDYEQFIQATGFEFERDLDEAAIAIHYPEQPAKAGGVQQIRFSEVFVGKIQGERLREYLQKISNSVENYRSVDIYSIPLEGRTVRAAILGVDTVAASNQPDAQVIRGIVDRSRKLASPFAGPALLRQYYKHVPFASLGWAILRVAPDQGLPTPTWAFLFNKPSTLLASVRYLGAVHFKAVAFTPTEEDAKRITDQLSTFLQVFHTAENTVEPSGSDADVKALFGSLKVEQEKDRTVLTAVVPLGFIRKALAEGPNLTTEPKPEQKPTPAPGIGPGKKGRK